MMRLIRIFLVVLALVSLSAIGPGPLTVYAAVPHLINYQGRVTDISGNSLNGSYDLTFRIYDAESAGNLLWQETQAGVVVDKGLFGILLGSATPLNIAFDKPYFLEIKVGTEVMSPRQRITAAGYALRAEVAESVSGFDPGMVGTKTVDEAAIGDKKIIYYDSSSGKVKYKEPAGWQFVDKRTGDNKVLNENFIMSPNVRYRFSWRMWQNTGAGGTGEPYVQFNSDTSSKYSFIITQGNLTDTKTYIQVADAIYPLSNAMMGSFELESQFRDNNDVWLSGNYIGQGTGNIKRVGVIGGFYDGTTTITSMQFKHSGAGYLYYEIICEKFVNG